MKLSKKRLIKKLKEKESFIFRELTYRYQDKTALVTYCTFDAESQTIGVQEGYNVVDGEYEPEAIYDLDEYLDEYLECLLDDLKEGYYTKLEFFLITEEEFKRHLFLEGGNL